jgi:RND family efflux transporter MFP subunit
MNFNRPGHIDPEKIEPGETDREINAPPVHRKRSRGKSLLWGPILMLLVVGVLANGARNHYAQSREVDAIAEASRDMVPQVHVETLQPSDKIDVVSLPATTSAFSAANIFARASGYIAKREVDIGDHVKAGQLLAEIVAPELDHQITQAQATLGQLQAALQQAQANRELAKVTWDRDGPLVKEGWLTKQQGTTDVQTLKAQEAAVSVAASNVNAEQAQLQVLQQQKDYQRVVAPFDGIITQRNIDIGSLVQADATSGTFMFTIMQSNVIRTQVFVPQDEAFGLEPGINAVVHVPEIPDRTFPGKVTRIAQALQPGSRTLLTEIDIPNPDGALTPGIYCTIDLHIPRKTPSVMVPADAIIFNEHGVQVAVVEGGVVHLRKVNVVRDFGQHVDVDSGVKPGDQVVVNPAVNLAEGNKVQARLQSKPQTS